LNARLPVAAKAHHIEHDGGSASLSAYLKAVILAFQVDVHMAAVLVMLSVSQRSERLQGCLGAVAAAAKERVL